MTWVVAAVSLCATWLNVRKVRVCFLIWVVTNLTWCAYDFAHGLPAQGVLMAVYAALAAWGWRAWRPGR